MKFNPPQTLSAIADLLKANYIGDADFPVGGLNEIHVVEPGDIVFVDHPKYYDKALQSKASIVIINKEVECPEGKALIISDDPFRDFKFLIGYFGPFQNAHSAISPTAQIGAGTHIQPNAFVGNNVIIGKNCLIHANVSISDNTVIGDRVIIHPNTVLGGDAFYYKRRPEGYDKLISGGRIIIEDDVELGACCTIDRGVTGDTIIGQGSKLDNHVHIGHDTVVGKNCLFAAQVGVAGCVVIEDNVTMWGQVGVISGITIGAGAVVLAQSGVGKSLAPNTTYFGSPAGEARKKMKEVAGITQLPWILEKLREQS